MEFSSQFRPILQFRQGKQDLVHQDFIAAESQAKAIRTERNQLQRQHSLAVEELKQLNQSDMWDVPRVLSQREYVKQLQHLLTDVDAALTSAERKVESIRAVLLEARQDVQAVEKLMERERARHRATAQVRERLDFDGVMISHTFRRRDAA